MSKEQARREAERAAQQQQQLDLNKYKTDAERKEAQATYNQTKQKKGWF